MSRTVIAGSCSLALGLLAACSAGNTGSSSDEEVSSSGQAVTAPCGGHPCLDTYQPPPPKPPPVYIKPSPPPPPPPPTYPLPGCVSYGTDSCTSVCDENFTNCHFDLDALVLYDPTGAALPCTVYVFGSTYTGPTAGTDFTSGASERSYYVADCSDTPAVQAWPSQRIPLGLPGDEDVSVPWPYWYPNDPTDPSAPQTTGPIDWVPVGVPYEANLSTTQVTLEGANTDSDGTPHVYLRFLENADPNDKCTLSNGGFCMPPPEPISGFGTCSGTSCNSVAPPPVEPTPISGAPFP